MTRFLRILGAGCFVLILLGGAAWTATALTLHLEGAPRALALGALGAAVLGTFTLRWRGQQRAGWMALLILGLLSVGGYQSIRPQQDRDWASDVSRGVTAQITGNRVTLSDIRDFRWTSPTEAEQRWISGTYDLRALESVDMLTSVWDSPDIAHLLVSFGFTDGRQVVFSVEIRREADEVFNELGGFFRQFELVLIAATEDDIVKLRTHHRREEVSLFPVKLSAAQHRRLFLSYVEMAQQLEDTPRFYNTLGANCTTVVYGLARSLSPDLPLDWRLVLSGHLPEYLNDLGVLEGSGDMAARRGAALISDRARALAPRAPFSAGIRAR